VGNLGVATAISAGQGVTSNRPAIAVTPTDAYSAVNATAPTVSVPVQMSPRIRLRGSALDTGVFSNRTDDWTIDDLPFSGNPAYGLLRIGNRWNGAAYTYPMAITSTGDFGIGITSPASTLQVNGPITNVVSTSSGAFTCGTSSISFSVGNLVRLSPSNTIAAGTCGVTLANLVAGGNYTLIVTGNGAINSVTYSFSGYTFKYLPQNAATTANEDTIYTFVYDGTTVYVTWSGGYY
jgi:hypothetical protein